MLRKIALTTASIYALWAFAPAAPAHAAQHASCSAGCHATWTIKPNGVTVFQSTTILGRHAALEVGGFTIGGVTMTQRFADTLAVRAYGHGVACEIRSRKQRAPFTVRCASIASHPLRASLAYQVKP